LPDALWSYLLAVIPTSYRRWEDHTEVSLCAWFVPAARR